MTRVLYHFPLCPFSRKIRFLLPEKSLSFSLETEKFWEEKPFFLRMSPLCQFPVLKEDDGFLCPDSATISEYLEESYAEPSFLFSFSAKEKTEIRRLCQWFDTIFAQDVSMNLFFEKYLKFQNTTECVSPNAEILRSIRRFAEGYCHYLNNFLSTRYWLLGDHFSLADITAAAHISVVDYFGDITWYKHPILKEWYARIKSRPTFQPFLKDRLPGAIVPSPHYEDLDF